MILSFEKPTKIESTEKHNDKFSSDCYIPGTYVPNMSEADNERWKAKHIHGDDERVEIKKAINGVQMVIVVYKHSSINKSIYSPKSHNNVRISANGKINMTFDDWREFEQAVAEAMKILDM